MAVGPVFREWDELDYLAAGGMLVMTGSAVASFFPALRRVGMLIPVALGVAMMAVAAYGARQR